MESAVRKEEIVLATFMLDDMHLALNAQLVQEATILKKGLVPWPSGSEYIEGVMDLRGRVVPVFNLKKRLRRPQTQYSDDSRVAIVAIGEMLIGILFDGVKDVIRVTPKRIEILNEAFQGEDRIISGVINCPESERIVEVLDPLRLVSAGHLETLESACSVMEGTDVPNNAPEKTIRMVVFSYGGQEYAISIDFVKEVEVVEDVDRAFSSEFIEGAVTIHDVRIPLIRMNAFALENRESATGSIVREQTGIVLVLNLQDALCAAAIDNICEILTVKESEIIDTTVCRNNAVRGVIEPSEGRNIIVLDPSATFCRHLEDIRAINRMLRRDTLADVETTEDVFSLSSDDSSRNYLFFTAGELFAIKVQNVQEILPATEVVRPPGARMHMDGLVNLRKNLIPQFNLRSFLGYTTREIREADESKVIVLTTQVGTVALSVDNILSFASCLKETAVPMLTNLSPAVRAIFSSLIVSRSKSGEMQHALHIDADILVRRLAFRNSENSVEERCYDV